MKTLPTEIFEEIFLHLNQHDKLECMLVCSHWKRIIERYLLYHTLFINSCDNLNTLIEKILEEPDIANKIERVVISNVDDATEINEFLFLLPSLKTLYYLGRMSGILEDKVEYPWKTSIKEIIGFTSDGPTLNLLSHSLCPNLTTLRMGIEREYIHLFKNVPALTTLKLKNFDATFSDLETLHNNLPQLVSLTINYGTLSAPALTENNIQPAPSVTECAFMFDIFDPDTVEMKTNMLKYICEKYPNLTTLGYLNLHEVISGSTGEINKLGWTPLLTNLGSKLTKLTIGEPDCNIDFFKTLDQSNCQVDCLSLGDYNYPGLLTNIVQTRQIDYIQIFELGITEDVIIGGFAWLKQFKVLKKLKISSEADTISIKLNDILDNSPSTLKALSVTWFELSDIPESTKQYNHIQSLSFRWVSLFKNMDVFISQCFPKLLKLKLEYCTIPGNTLNLTNLDLFKFYFVIYSYKRVTTVLITCKNEQRWYRCRNSKERNLSLLHYNIHRQKSLYMPFESSTESKDLPDFTLICNSVKNVLFTI